MVGTVLRWGLLAVLVLVVVKNPAGAGATVHHAWTSVTTFLSNVAG